MTPFCHIKTAKRENDGTVFHCRPGKYEQITEQQNGWVERSKILLFFHFLRLSLFNSLLPVIDQNRISPYNINTLSSSQKLRIKKNNNEGIIS